MKREYIHRGYKYTTWGGGMITYFNSYIDHVLIGGIDEVTFWREALYHIGGPSYAPARDYVKREFIKKIDNEGI